MSGLRLFAAYALPPIAVVALAFVLFGRATDSGSGQSVQMFDNGALVGTGTEQAAVDYLIAKTGISPTLPAILPFGGYQLSGAYALSAAPAAGGHRRLNLTYERQRGDRAWFWVVQEPSGTELPPEGLPEVETAIEGARIWTLGEPGSEEPNPRFQFIARTAKYDRVISFEGAYRPDMNRARAVIESMLREDASE